MFDFRFLDEPAGFQIAQSWLPATPSDTYGWLLLAGLSNTLLVLLTALPLATALGLALGGLRLARHPLTSRCATALIEPIRNTPVLLQLFVWYALLLNLPGIGQAWTPVAGVSLSNRGLYLPALQSAGGGIVWLGLVCLLLASVWLQRRLRPEAAAWRRALLPGAALVLAALLAWHGDIGIDWPRRRGLGLEGGWHLSPEFAALVLGLSLFHAAYLSDIVRSAILSVPAGQVHAARALGFGPVGVARFAIAPFALRAAIPPYGNQCLMLLKNSTLAIAIGFPEIMAIVGTTITQTGRALEGMLLALAFYVGIGLALAAGIARYNRRTIRHGIDGLGAARLRDNWQPARLSGAGLWGTPWRATQSALLLVIAAWLAWQLARWAVFDARWTGQAAQCGDIAGACWLVWRDNWRLLLFGTMDASYRPTAAWTVALLAIGASVACMRLPARRRAGAVALAWLAGAACLAGVVPDLPAIPVVQWGGLLATAIMACACIVLAVCLAIPMTLLRRSRRLLWRLPVVALIEVSRAVPLVAQLVLAVFLVPVLLGGDWSGAKFQIALGVLTLHAASQLSEVLRGAFQAIAASQALAGKALGMSPATLFLHVLLPQARRIAAPAALGVFVGAIKDTSLVMVIGLFDVLSAAKAVAASTTWRPYYAEVYAGVALFYCLLCLGLSRLASRHAAAPATVPPPARADMRS